MPVPLQGRDHGESVRNFSIKLSLQSGKRFSSHRFASASEANGRERTALRVKDRVANPL
jgi:hypothetical protein